MQEEEFFIVLHQGDWHIRLRDKHFGPLRTEREATEVATTVAERAVAQGIDATVFTQDAGGDFRQIWPAPADPAAAIPVARPDPLRPGRVASRIT